MCSVIPVPAGAIHPQSSRMGYRVFGPVFLLLGTAALGCGPHQVNDGRPEVLAPDIGVRWVEPEEADAAAVVGTRAEIAYYLYNQGVADADAVIVETHTTLGPLRPPHRLEPGPGAGATLHRVEHLAVVEGMRELCVEVRLQTLAADSPPDRNLANNRICRSLEPTIADAGAPASARTTPPVQIRQPAQTRREARSKTDPTGTRSER